MVCFWVSVSFGNLCAVGWFCVPVLFVVFVRCSALGAAGSCVELRHGFKQRSP